MSILDEPIEKAHPKGYAYCPKCNAYEHHKMVYCSHCDEAPELQREKKATWREFLVRTAHCGSGPLNTIYSILSDRAGVPWLTPLKEWPNEYHVQYEEAVEIQTMAGGGHDSGPHTRKDGKSVSLHKHEWIKITYTNPGDFTHYCRCGALRRYDGSVMDVGKQRRLDNAMLLKRE